MAVTIEQVLQAIADQGKRLEQIMLELEQVAKWRNESSMAAGKILGMVESQKKVTDDHHAEIVGTIATIKSAPGAKPLPLEDWVGDALHPLHVFHPSRRGLSEYEHSRLALGKIRKGETIEIVHLGKEIEVGYDRAHELLRDAGLR